ncbi:MAG: hypothetical protein LBU32_24460 [Clostridiales bacterium]|nr:hypothetical protein [Clostridiales bacterium]
MPEGADAGAYHDELVTLLSLTRNASDESIAEAWSEVHTGEDEEGGSPHEEEQNSHERS